jgi:predicted peptidase
MSEIFSDEDKFMEKYSDKYGMTPAVFTADNGEKLNYCRKIIHPEMPGALPVLLFLHGAGERGGDNDAQLRHGAAEIIRWCEKNSCKVLLLFPQCPENQQWVDTPWNATGHTLPPESAAMKLVRQMLDMEISRNSADISRIYVCGISMGGYGTWDILSRDPEKFAAAFPVCGGADLNMAEKLTGIPILTYHGDNDFTVPVSRTRDMVNAIRNAGGQKLSYVELSGCGHNSWEPAFAVEKNWEWLFACRK